MQICPLRDVYQSGNLARQQKQDREIRFGRSDNLPDETAFKASERPPHLALDSFASLRIQALYIFSPALGSCSTKAVLSWANAFVPPSTLLGMEWIDDTSAVLVFSSFEHAMSGLQALLLDELLMVQLQHGISQLEDIYSEQTPEALAILAQAHLARPLTVRHESEVAWVRIARQLDKKQADARQRSQYYAERQVQRDERQKDELYPDRRADLATLDAELDAFVGGADSSVPFRADRPIKSSPRRLPDRRDVDLAATDRRRDRRNEIDELDRELDSYTNGTEHRVPPPSQHRRRSPSPPRPEPVNAGVELFHTNNGLSLLQRLSAKPVLDLPPPSPEEEEETEEEYLQEEVLEEDDNAHADAYVEQPRDVLANISVGYQPSLFSQGSARPHRQTAADLFDDPIPKRKEKMRGWVSPCAPTIAQI